MNPVELVTVKEKRPLYSKGVEAERVEQIILNEFSYDLISQKGNYVIGSHAIYIQPDYLLPDTELFVDFLRPIDRKTGERNPDLCILGKSDGVRNRIRAKQFNLMKSKNSTEKIFSNGILLPVPFVREYLVKNDLIKGNEDFRDLDLTKLLRITKNEEASVLGEDSPMSDKIYKTDEENIHNLELQFPLFLRGTIKEDGSSVTLGMINGEPSIFSRQLKKSINIREKTGDRELSFVEKILSFFGKKYNTEIFEWRKNTKDNIVKYALPYLNFLVDLGHDNFLLRGELRGEQMKGSGNKYNNARNLKDDIRFFALDRIDDFGRSVKQNQSEFKKFLHNANNPVSNSNHDDLSINFIPVSTVFEQHFGTKENIIEKCKQIFEAYKKDDGILLEGIVLSNQENTISFKVMNEEYDSKK